MEYLVGAGIAMVVMGIVGRLLGKSDMRILHEYWERQNELMEEQNEILRQMLI